MTISAKWERTAQLAVMAALLLEFFSVAAVVSYAGFISVAATALK